MQPKKKTACTNPTLNLSPQIKPQSETVEPPRPPIHSLDSGERPHKSPPSQAAPATHFQSGSRSAKIMTMVWKASSAHARLVRMKCLSCHRPNSPQCFCSMSSMQSFSIAGFFAATAAAGSIGERRSWMSEEGNVAAIQQRFGRSLTLFGLALCVIYTAAATCVSLLALIILKGRISRGHWMKTRLSDH